MYGLPGGDRRYPPMSNSQFGHLPVNPINASGYTGGAVYHIGLVGQVRGLCDLGEYNSELVYLYLFRSVLRYSNGKPPNLGTDDGEGGGYKSPPAL